ncbi:MAG: methyltransferase domain-containing protein [Ardenticatenaceae bacterium]|nr:methyltransferase domain-containing protein [Ardenticatenaceae bacterium]
MNEAPFSRYREIIDDWDAFQAAVQRPLPATIWTNPLRTTPEKLASLLDAPLEPVAWYPGAFRLPPDFPTGLHWAYLAGLYHVQEEVSLLPVRLLDVQPGERILDLCAAPGNKTAQLGIALGNRGTVVANDRNAGRMRAARQALNRLGLLNITTTTSDAANYPKTAGPFDKVLADVPCSCEGTCRKDPSITRRQSVADSLKLVGAQTAVLRKAVQRCRPGGRIVYATCTFAPEENEGVVDAILREFGRQLRLLPVQTPGFVTSPGLTAWQGQALHPDLRHALRIWPHQNDTGGFFIAVLQKAGSLEEEDPPPQAPPTEEREPWLALLHDHFGIDPAALADFAIFREGRRGVYIANRDQRPTVRPKPDAVGMLFMHTDGKYPKLTTGAAMQFGHLAQQNVLDLSHEQVQAYLARREFEATAGQTAVCSGTGYVLVRHQGFPLGIGVYRANRGTVESLYPKGWARQNVL